MQDNDTTQRTDESTSTNGNTRRRVLNQASNDSESSIELTRRGVMRTTAGVGAAGLALGAGLTGSAAATGIQEFQNLTVSSDNRIVNEDGETFKMRGLSIPDPKRLHRTRFLRGKTPTQLLDMVTDPEQGWYPRAIRVPAQPQDIGEHPMGHTGPEYEPGELESPDVVDDDRRKMRPPQPVAFTQAELDDYLETHYDPIVERCKERGVYCIVDYHRHWHEQPPGKERPAAAENHLPYNSDYTNYWAYNTHEAFGEEAPGSWGHVDQVTINELTPGYDGWAGIVDESDIPGTPYAYENWTVNEELLEEVLMFWDTVAERYADEPHVIFEPYNEPTAPGIWGPVQGCGAIKQKPLWDTFVDDFMGPIIEKIREYQSDRVLLVGVPGWCQSIQALHWRNFNEAGYDNIAVTWHNYAGHDVSQVNNWFNDTDYKSPEAVEAETGKELEDPYIAPPDSVDQPDCWGWEAYEAAGLQNAMDHHPIAISEFGWINDPEVSHWLRGSTTGLGTTFEYGEPFLNAVEQDDRISWIGWCADVRWLPKMFEYPGAPEEGDLELVNDNFYDTPMADIPVGCEELPCEWELLGGEDSGQYLKDRLEMHKDDLVPFETGSVDDTLQVGEYEPQDPDGDGLYDDVNGDGQTTHADVNAFYENIDADGVQDNPDAFDFDGNGRIGFADVLDLLRRI
ncbi:cellulase family glycosylhydrolase [Natrinema salaciae]|uniref:Cellulase (Glycosyl hydrolase family 5) n=1 Tax=Natrinema salaciae TaxID=1186196 RepID=A0A1H9IGR6_9EURY|nr:cellulase family glycosylhydrolase [Natrinema salaciae]SEQ73759.1 Cellulase (glycosyl hydrolase family 5) [Natrinema salaciae]